MATMQVATVTAEAPKVTNPHVVRELLRDEYTLGLNFKLEGSDEDQLVIWGYDTFSPWSHDVNGDIIDSVGDELLYRLSQYIKDSEHLTLRTGGFTKCRSVYGVQWTVYPNLVVYSSLDSEPMVVTPPDTLAEVMDEDALDGLGDVEALEDGKIEEYGIGPAVPGHQQKYPEEVLAAVREDDRVEEVDPDDDVWEFNSEDASWRGGAGEVRAFAAAFDARSEA